MFRPKHSFAINFSDYSIEALELDREHATLVPKTYSRILLESGIVENGKIIDAAKLREMLKQLLAQAQPHPITAKEVVITVPESQVFVQTYALPQTLNAKQVPSALFSQARETLPIDVSLIMADYSPVGVVNGSTHYLFAAAYTKVLQEYVKTFESLQLKVVLATMESLALAAATIDESKKDETVLLLDMGARTTIASVFRGGALQESININIAGGALTNALAEKLKISRADAEQRKMRIGLKNANGDGAELLIMQGQLQPLKDELMVFIKFYEEKMQDTIDRVLVSGGSAALAGIDEYFSSNLGLPAQIAMPLPYFRVTAAQSDMQRYLIVLGLARIAFGDRQSTVNFLEHTEKDWMPTKKSIRDIRTVAAEGGGFRAMTQQPKRNRRKLLYGLLLLAAALLLAGVIVWKNYLPGGSGKPAQGLSGVIGKALTFVVRPTPSTQEKNLTFAFMIATDPKAAQSGDFVATLEKFILSNQEPFPVFAIDDLRNEMIQKEGGLPPEGEIAVALPPYLAGLVWESQKFGRISEKEREGKRLLASYLDVVIDESLTNIIRDGDKLGAGTKVVAAFTVPALADPAGFQAFEDEQVSSFVELNPVWKVSQKRFTYGAPDPAGRMRVLAAYTFVRTSQ